MKIRQQLDNLINQLDSIDRDGRSISLPETGTWPETKHVLTRPDVNAIIAAVAAGRPLLVRGETGVGKSQLARAAAKILNRGFLSFVVQPNTEYQDLLWTVDNLQRLADAHVRTHPADSGDSSLLTENYITPGPLWWAFDPEGEKPKCRTTYQPEDCMNYADPECGAVLLIDEIDKAETSVCLGLLEVLANRAFRVPQWKNNEIKFSSSVPLVIFTSNDTRQLPAAFLRRCVILDMKLPTGPELVTHLVKLGEAHWPSLTLTVLEEAASNILEARKISDSTTVTGQAEYLDLLRALQEISDSEESQLQWLEMLSNNFIKTTFAR